MIKLKSNENQSQAVTAHAESIFGLLAIPATLYLYRSSDIINIMYNPDMRNICIFYTITISKNQNHEE